LFALAPGGGGGAGEGGGEELGAVGAEDAGVEEFGEPGGEEVLADLDALGVVRVGVGVAGVARVVGAVVVEGDLAAPSGLAVAGEASAAVVAADDAAQGVDGLGLRVVAEPGGVGAGGMVGCCGLGGCGVPFESAQ